MKRKTRKLLSMFMALIMLLSVMSITALASETPEYTTRDDIVGYSAALVERKDLSKVENIQKYWDDDEGDILEYKITNAEDLVFFAGLVKQKQEFYGMTVYIANDIDLSSVAVFEPIGGWSNGTQWATPCFRGTFDGQGYSIKNMNMTMPTEQGGPGGTKNPVDGNNAYLGFFRCLGLGATIKNLVLDETCLVSGGENVDASVVGAIAGCIDTNKGANTTAEHTVTISNVYSAADVKHGGVTGGFVGVVKSVYLTIDHCTAAGDVTLITGATGSSFNGRGVGGFVGMMGENKTYPVSVKITNSRNAGKIESFNGPAGGIVGHFHNPDNDTTTTNVKLLEIVNCINTGNVSVANAEKTPVAAAGILGYGGVKSPGGSLTIKNCINYGTATAAVQTIATNQIVNTADGATNVTLEGNQEKQGQTDSTLAEALWQNLVTIATPPPASDGGNNNQTQNGSSNNDSNDDSNNDNSETTPNTDDEKTADDENTAETAEEEESGCGAVIAMLPISLVAIGSATVICRKKED